MDYVKPFRYILEIAQCKNISTAAEKLDIQQPALSKYLKKVETELGVELFDRSTSPLMLTEAGKCYLATAKKIIDIDNQLQKSIADIKKTDINIRIGISPSRAPYILPSIIKNFSEKEPNARITIVEGSVSELSSGLSNGSLDLIISLLDKDTQNFEHVDLFDESVYLAVSGAHKNLSFYEAISNLNLISSGRGQLLSNILDTVPNHLSIIECQNIITAYEMVRDDIGAALVPSYLVDYGNTEDIIFFEIPEDLFVTSHRTVSIFYRKEQFISSVERSFIECSVLVTHKKKRTIRNK